MVLHGGRGHLGYCVVMTAGDSGNGSHWFGAASASCY